MAHVVVAGFSIVYIGHIIKGNRFNQTNGVG